jgi:methionine aminopeptidase
MEFGSRDDADWVAERAPNSLRRLYCVHVAFRLPKPTERNVDRGDIISLDSGANQSGYLGDLCRMAILGKADAELTDLLAGC